MRKSLSWLHLLLAVIALLSSILKGQSYFDTEDWQSLFEHPPKIEEKVHIIPYRLVPAFDGCLVSVEFVSPVTFHNMEDIQRNQTTEIFRERIAYELAVPFEQNQVFIIDDRYYYMLQVPYDGSFWNFKE
tara:strand:+ start:169 stop:558 length:390 start_codon:yes stop_codon:yes gene_type:complete